MKHSNSMWLKSDKCLYVYQITFSHKVVFESFFCFEILYTPYISRGFYFREFRESGAIREFINTRKYLPPIPTHECDLCTQYIALLDREFNHSRKCPSSPDSRKIRLAKYMAYTVFFFVSKRLDFIY